MSVCPPVSAPAIPWRELPCPEPSARGFTRVQVWRPSGAIVRCQVVVVDRHELTYWDELRGENARIHITVRSDAELFVLCGCIDDQAAEVARKAWEWKKATFDALGVARTWDRSAGAGL